MASRKLTTSLLGSLVSAMLLAGCASSGGYSSSSEPLTGPEIEAVLTGNSISGEQWDGPFTVYFPTYGKMLGVRSTHYRDSGTWRVEEESLCAKWDDWWGGVENCWSVYLDGTTINWRRPDSDTTANAELREGNPAGL